MVHMGQPLTLSGGEMRRAGGGGTTGTEGGLKWPTRFHSLIHKAVARRSLAAGWLCGINPLLHGNSLMLSDTVLVEMMRIR